MTQVLMFICPNQDSFHGHNGEHVQHLVIHGMELRESVESSEEYQVIKTYQVVPAEGKYIMLDDPSDAQVIAISGSLLGARIIREKRVCSHCLAKGVK